MLQNFYDDDTGNTTGNLATQPSTLSGNSAQLKLAASAVTGNRNATCGGYFFTRFKDNLHIPAKCMRVI
jgi:hypothetical protein